MSIFENKNYINFIKTTQYATLLLEDIMHNEDKKQKMNTLIITFFNSLLYNNFKWKIEDFTINLKLINFNQLNEQNVKLITDNQFYYPNILKEYGEFVNLNISNDVEELNIFAIIEISFMDEGYKALLSRHNSSLEFDLIVNKPNYKGVCITHISELSKLLFADFNLFS